MVALSSSVLRRSRKRATYWGSWRSSACRARRSPKTGHTAPGSSPHCWTYLWMHRATIPETSEALPPPEQYFPTGCWPETRPSNLLSARTSTRFAPFTSMRPLCAQAIEEDPLSGRASPEEQQRKVSMGLKAACSRYRMQLAGVGPQCCRCSV